MTLRVDWFGLSDDDLQLVHVRVRDDGAASDSAQDQVAHSSLQSGGFASAPAFASTLDVDDGDRPVAFRASQPALTLPGGFAPNDVHGIAMSDEVAFISGVYPDGTQPLYSFYAWNDDNPATYTGGYTNSRKWGSQTAHTDGGTITYSFDVNSNWTQTEKGFLAAGLSLWSAVANISFSEVSTFGGAQLVFRRGNDHSAGTSTQTTGNGLATAGMTGSAVLLQLTHATISIDTSGNGFGPILDFGTDGGYPIQTLLHEEGHAIGLGHGGPYNGTVNESQQQFSPYDTRLWSIMSYIEPRTTSAAYYNQYPVKGSNWGLASDGSRNDPTGLMPLDILAAQALYGTPTSTPLSGGQTFGFHSNVAGPSGIFFDFTQNTNPVLTLWDAGTNNTLDVSGWSEAATINLNSGTFSSMHGMVDNLAIASGTRIDNFVGGGGNDLITANSNGDHIDGGAGVDKLILDDSAINSGLTLYFISAAASAPAGSDGTTILNVEAVSLSTGSGNDTVTLGNVRNTGIWSGSAWDAGGGNDTAIVDYSSSTTLINGNNFSDPAVFHITDSSNGSVDLLHVENYAITTGSGGSTITTGDGNDVMTGGSGNDFFSVGAGSNTVNAGSGTDQVLDQGGASVLDGGDGIDRLNLSRVDYAGPITMSFTPGSSTPSALPDGTTFKNFEVLYLATAGGDDQVTFVEPIHTIFLESWWHDFGGNDTAIVDLSLDATAVTASGTIDNYSISDGTGGLLTLTGVEKLRISGGAGNDTLNGLGGDDALQGGGGNDALNGGGGTDTAVFTGNFANYTITSLGGGSFRIIDNRAGSPDGTDLTNAVEQAKFADGTHILGAAPPVSSDFNGDGKSDIVWQNDNGAPAIWLMDGLNLVSGGYAGDFNPGPSWHIKGTADFSGDGKSDIVWQNDDGSVAVWVMNGLSLISATLVGGGNPGSAWHIKSTGDFNGDGKTDIVSQNDDGSVAMWLMDGLNVSGGGYAGGLNPGPAWHVGGAGDFNGDGKSDIVWQNDDGSAAIWFMDGLNMIGGGYAGGLNPGPAWHIKGTADFNGDGKSDIVWQNDDGSAAIWFMNGLTMLSGGYAGGLNPGHAWHIKGTGDFNGDGKSDIVWQNDSGAAAIWFMDGLNMLSGGYAGGIDPGPSWHIDLNQHGGIETMQLQAGDFFLA